MKYLFIINLLIFIGCKQPIKKWQFEKELKLENVHPIGGAILNDELWLSDGDKNRLVQISENGEVLDEITGLERPMHIDSFENMLLIPEYGKDVISIYTNKVRDSLKNVPNLDAPAGISKYRNELAIADFYNNTIHYYNGESWLKIGEKGTSIGQLNYPTDVQITNEYIYVADAYNHRIQVFNKKGVFIQMLGQNQSINAATGLLIDGDDIYVTDFENNRLLVFSETNEVLQIIDTELSKPTDVLIFKEKLYVLNYKSSSVSVFVKG